MIFETVQHMCIAAIGMLESERETSIDFTNQNGIEFGISIRKYGEEFQFGLFIGCEEAAYFESFLKSSNPETITAKHVIDAAIKLADFVEEKKNIDQYDLVELKNRHYDHN